MNKNLTIWLPYVVAVLLFGVLGFYFYYDLTRPSPVVENRNKNGTTIPNIEIGSVGGSGNFTIEKIEDPVSASEHPQLERPIIFPASFGPNARIIMVGKIDASIKALKSDPLNTDEWQNLAIYRKMLNDYKGAQEIWFYLTKILKNPSYIYANLADLYGYFLKQPAKAEPYYKDAIRLEPGNIEYYTQFASFYLDVMKQPDKAIALVEAGYANNSTRPDFKLLLEEIKNRISYGN